MRSMKKVLLWQQPNDYKLVISRFAASLVYKTVGRVQKPHKTKPHKPVKSDVASFKQKQLGRRYSEVHNLDHF